MPLGAACTLFLKRNLTTLKAVNPLLIGSNHTLRRSINDPVKQPLDLGFHLSGLTLIGLCHGLGLSHALRPRIFEHGMSQREQFGRRRQRVEHGNKLPLDQITPDMLVAALTALGEAQIVRVTLTRLAAAP
ncbi:hypothetical protein [Gemmobacter serpentinus]|uniref:hypothetical protein n=1 Tax=Gemmobacter serpentinus TaxID=2652247 RepID=UPI0021F5B510|nr:hypothetical protein [Gemmobacter serpentinus]